MIKAVSLFTLETETPEEALEDILSQLTEKIELQKYTAGILHCGYDAMESGAASRVCEGVGFPVVGCTSVAQAVNEAADGWMLTLMVLTSDDVKFFETHTEGLAEDLEEAVERSFPDAAQNDPEFPVKLILAFSPLLEQCAGDDYLRAFQAVFGKVPVFGSLAVEDEMLDFSRNATLCNGEYFSEECVYLLLCGNVSPRFFVDIPSVDSHLMEAGIITKSRQNVLQEIDGVRTDTFFERIGLAQNGALSGGVEYVPFILRIPENEGREEVRICRGAEGFHEDGGVVFRGVMPEDVILSVGVVSPESVEAAARERAGLLNQEHRAAAVLMYSCIVRRNVLGVTPMAELGALRETIRPDIPFFAAYSGGEFCPTRLTDGEVTNLFHNFALVTCVL